MLPSWWKRLHVLINLKASEFSSKLLNNKFENAANSKAAIRFNYI
jgi:hypothetical protein